MSKGRYERELVRSLAALGFAPVRCPSSGGGTDRDLPDVIVGRNADHPPEDRRPLDGCYALELKTTSSTAAYADAEEVEALSAFASTFGAQPRIVARFKGGGRTPYYFVPIGNCRLTDAGSYGIPKADATDRADVLVYPETDARDAEVDPRD